MGFVDRLLGLSDTRARTDVATTARNPQVGTGNATWASPGMPQWQAWDGETALRNGYYGSVHVYRCLNKKARDLARLPIRVGADPDQPTSWRTDHPLARLLGPPPGGPNPGTAARALIAWSFVQRFATGRTAWEIARNPNTGQPAAFWPLVSWILQPIPTVPPGQFPTLQAKFPGLSPNLAIGPGRPDEWFAGYRYTLPTGFTDLRPEQVFYSWRPSALDWRQAESALQAAALPISITREFDRYNWALLKNDLSARKLVITPNFEEDDERIAWQEQFLTELTGVNNAGRTMFAEYDPGETGTDNQGRPIPPVQVHDLGMTSVDSQLLELAKEAKRDIYVGLGMPESIAGDASERTFANADTEHLNYWEELRSDATEFTDDINTYLAPQFGDDVVWFDFSDIAALKSSRKFQAASPVDLVAADIVDTNEVRDDIGLEPREIPAPPAAAVAVADGQQQVRAAGTATRLTDKVHALLSETYPERVLGWVDDADWSYDGAVPLDEIKMGRRPGARDPQKVEGIAQALRDGKAMDPVVLVEAPGCDRYCIADGYHRTLAFEKAGRKTIPAYIGKVDSEHGPWETAMHDAKQNRSAPGRTVHDIRAAIDAVSLDDLDLPDDPAQWLTDNADDVAACAQAWLADHEPASV